MAVKISLAAFKKAARLNKPKKFKLVKSIFKQITYLHRNSSFWFSGSG